MNEVRRHWTGPEINWKTRAGKLTYGRPFAVRKFPFYLCLLKDFLLNKLITL